MVFCSFFYKVESSQNGHFLLNLVMNAISFVFSYMNIIIGGGKHTWYTLHFCYDSVSVIVRHKLGDIYDLEKDEEAVTSSNRPVRSHAC